MHSHSRGKTIIAIPTLTVVAEPEAAVLSLRLIFNVYLQYRPRLIHSYTGEAPAGWESISNKERIRHYRLHLRKPRGAEQLLTLPMGVEIKI